MTIREASQQLQSLLAKLYTANEAAAIVAMVMEDITGWPRQQTRSRMEEPLNEREETTLARMQERLLRHEPVQYVLGKSWFYNLEFAVDASVLIPRPETEELVQWILEERNQRSTATILDIGTGSGCIAIALAKNWPEAQVHAMDVSTEALALAKRNGRALDVEVTWMQANILEEEEWPTLSIDLIASNPPYIPKQESGSLDKNVSEWEPHLALFVPDSDPLLFYRKIAAFARKHLKPWGSVYFECHQQYAAAVMNMLIADGFAVELKKDLFGNERMVKAAWHGPTIP